MAAVMTQYAEVFAALPEPAFLTRGTSTCPRLWARTCARGTVSWTGASTRAADVRFRRRRADSAYSTPNEIDEDVRGQGRGRRRVDVLCCHIPPALPS